MAKDTKPRKLTIDQIEQALRANGGWFTQAAKALGVSHQAISTRVQKSERLQRVTEDVKAQYLDLAESKLMQKIKDGDLGAICFYLKCQGRQRGYVEKAKLDANITQQEPLTIEKDKDSHAKD
jgi:hypothetical protein